MKKKQRSDNNLDATNLFVERRNLPSMLQGNNYDDNENVDNNDGNGNNDYICQNIMTIIYSNYYNNNQVNKNIKDDYKVNDNYNCDIMII